MDLKKIDLDKLQDYAFTVNEIETYLGDNNYKFINFKCLDNESLIPTVKAISIDEIKAAKEEIKNIDMGSYLEVIKEIECNDREVRLSKKFAIAILDKLIAESED